MTEHIKFKSPTANAVHVALSSGNTAVVGPDPRTLPVIFHREAVAKGCIPVVEGQDVQEVAVQADAPGFDRRAVILDAMETLVQGENPADFIGDGRPDVRAVSRVAGFQITAEERDTLWTDLSEG